MAWLSGWVGILFGFVLFLSRGLSQVILVNALNRRIPGRFRATVNSLNSLIFRFGFIVAGPLMGLLAQDHGVAFALNAVGAMLVVSFFAVMLPLILAVRKLLLATTVQSAQVKPGADATP